MLSDQLGLFDQSDQQKPKQDVKQMMIDKILQLSYQLKFKESGTYKQYDTDKKPFSIQ